MAEFTTGQRATWTKTITEADVYAFAGITGDFNPLHVDREYAARSRFGERIAHGLLTAGLVSAVLGMRLPGPGGIFLSQTLTFVRPVRFGDTVTATAEVLRWDSERRILTLRTACANQRGETVLEGEAVLLVERPGTGRQE
ncbi:MAG: MaoC family dehydratase [Armatimonadota bacterium]|nr:MaoC family dehydratase [Armatimonadota bacterium]MDR7451637.1 MaoC family dehydratase [Armatimonadota bacterium]MDR7467643.1 MaoC family dehydratase [Armatimonadota bacterium]MDR7492606.1 MaoC family dehydratase [Armatimonadota bacterium]MDR7499926.1 MaoC family dehydratase [Armatimonadota bacterium]